MTFPRTLLAVTLLLGTSPALADEAPSFIHRPLPVVLPAKANTPIAYDSRFLPGDVARWTLRIFFSTMQSPEFLDINLVPVGIPAVVLDRPVGIQFSRGPLGELLSLTLYAHGLVARPFSENTLVIEWDPSRDRPRTPPLFPDRSPATPHGEEAGREAAPRPGSAGNSAFNHSLDFLGACTQDGTTGALVHRRDEPFPALVTVGKAIPRTPYTLVSISPDGRSIEISGPETDEIRRIFIRSEPPSSRRSAGLFGPVRGEPPAR